MGILAFFEDADLIERPAYVTESDPLYDIRFIDTDLLNGGFIVWCEGERIYHLQGHDPIYVLKEAR